MRINSVDKKLFVSIPDKQSYGGDTLAGRVARWLEFQHSGEFDVEAARLLEEAVTGCSKRNSNGQECIGEFPPSYFPQTFTKDKAFGLPNTYIPLDYFYLMQTLYQMSHNDLSKLPWDFDDLLEELCSAVSIACPSLWSRLIRVIMWLLISVAAGALAYLCYWVSDVKNFGGTLVALLCWGIALLAIPTALIGALNFFIAVFDGPSKQDIQDLKWNYVNILRFVRLRILWCKAVTGQDSVAEYLVDAQKMIEMAVKPARRKLRRLLGIGWGIPKEAVLDRAKLRTGPAPSKNEQNVIAISVERGELLRKAAKDAYTSEGDMEKAGQLYYESALADPTFAVLNAELYLEMEDVDYELAESICLLGEGDYTREIVLHEIWRRGSDHYRKLINAKLYEQRKMPTRTRVLFFYYDSSDIRPWMQKAAYFTRKLIDARLSADYYWCVYTQIYTFKTVDDAKELCRWIDLYRKHCKDDAEFNRMMRRAGNRFHKLACDFDQLGLAPLGDKLYMLMAKCGEERCMCELSRRYVNTGRYRDAEYWAYAAMRSGGNEQYCRRLLNAIKDECRVEPAVDFGRLE